MNQLRELLRQYVNGAIDLSTFRQRMVVQFLSVRNADPAVEQMANLVECECADFSEGLVFSEDALRQSLSLLCDERSPFLVRGEPMVVPRGFQQVIVSTGTSTVSLVETAVAEQLVGESRASEYAS
jgi:hypothetical protein